MTRVRAQRFGSNRSARPMLAAGLALLVIVVSGVAFGLPSNPSSAYQPSPACGCHAGLIEQWRPSMHAKALTDPLYLLKLKEAEAAVGKEITEYCNGCHGPIAVMSGEIDGLDQSKLAESSAEGVTCDFCHQVTGTTMPIGNTSAKVAADGTKRAQFFDSISPVHETEGSEFHTTAEFCGTCHDVLHPADLSFHLEATYTEWKNGPYAKEGIVCQDCHMTPGPGVTKPNPGKAASMAAEREHIYIMTFAGGNVGLGDSVNAEQRLKAAAKLDLEVETIVASGGKVAVTTTITNVGAGHYIPTGLTEVRQMWLEVVAVDAAGTEVMRQRRDFGTVLQDAEGNHPVELWEAASFYSDDRIPPRESTSNEYEFTMPEGPVTVTAALRYRSASEEMAAKAGVEIPTTTMAEAAAEVFASADQQAEATRGGDDTEASSPLVWVASILTAAVAAGVVVLMLRRRGA